MRTYSQLFTYHKNCHILIIFTKCFLLVMLRVTLWNIVPWLQLTKVEKDTGSGECKVLVIPKKKCKTLSLIAERCNGR
jgi:hypothetical protein